MGGFSGAFKLPLIGGSIIPGADAFPNSRSYLVSIRLGLLSVIRLFLIWVLYNDELAEISEGAGIGRLSDDTPKSCIL